MPVKGFPENFDQYEKVLIGFPIWYGCAPNVVNTFCRELDFTGKAVGVFATSGGSKIGKSGEKLNKYLKGADVKAAVLFRDASDEELRNWAESI